MRLQWLAQASRVAVQTDVEVRWPQWAPGGRQGSISGFSGSGSGSQRRGKRGPSSRFSLEADGNWKPILLWGLCLPGYASPGLGGGTGGTEPSAPMRRERTPPGSRGPSCTEGVAPEWPILVVAPISSGKKSQVLWVRSPWQVLCRAWTGYWGSLAWAPLPHLSSSRDRDEHLGITPDT